MTLKKLLFLTCMGTVACGLGQKQKGGTSTVNNTGVKAKVTLIAGSPSESADRFKTNDHADPLKARFFKPDKLVLDDRNNVIYVSDGETDLRKIDKHGVTTLMKDFLGASNFVLGMCAAPDSAGYLYVTSTLGELCLVNTNLPHDAANNPKPIIAWKSREGMRKEGNETGSLDIAGAAGCYGLAAGPDGKIVLGSHYYKTVRLVNFANKGNEVAVLAGKPTEGVSAHAYDLVDGPALQATFGEVNGAAVDGNGTVYVADGGYSTIRAIKDGVVRSLLKPAPDLYKTYAGKDGSLQEARSGSVKHIAVTRDGKRIFFATWGKLRMIQDQQNVITLAQFKEGIQGIAISVDGSKVIVSSGYGVYSVEGF